MLAGHDLLLVIIAIADGHLTIQLLQQFQTEGIIAVCLLKNPEESYFIQFLNDYNQFQNYWDRSPYYGKCSKHFNPPVPLFNVVFYLPSSLMNQSVSTYNSTLIGEGRGENIWTTIFTYRVVV